MAEVGVLVPLIVVPVAAVTREHDWPAGTTHVAVDGNRRQLAAQAAGLPLPCVVCGEYFRCAGMTDMAGALGAVATGCSALLLLLAIMHGIVGNRREAR